jgi:uncharacterized protein (DUF1786 family)
MHTGESGRGTRRRADAAILPRVNTDGGREVRRVTAPRPGDRSGGERAGHDGRPLRVLAIDVGAGTQDVLVYESDRAPENCVKLVLPSQTQIVGRRIRAATAARRPLHLTGTVMGGGASTAAIADHLAAGLPVTATASAARTVHNDLARVEALGVVLRDDPPPDAVAVETKDVDLETLRAALAAFAVELPAIVAVAVQDHGYRPGASNNAVRFEYLQALVEDGGELGRMVYRDPPNGMTRMAGVKDSVPGAYLMDTGAAAVLGALGDPAIARAVAADGAILVNVGNMHTFATLVKGNRLFGLFEHHTGGITARRIGELVERLRDGSIDGDTFTERFDGHGAALDPGYFAEGPFRFVAVTGPHRGIARPLGYHEAAPHGDMMLTGAFGLVEGTFLALRAAGEETGLTLVATPSS